MFGIKTFSSRAVSTSLAKPVQKTSLVAPLVTKRNSVIDEEDWTPSPAEARYAELYPPAAKLGPMATTFALRYADPDDDILEGWGSFVPTKFMSRDKNPRSYDCYRLSEVTTFEENAKTDENEDRVAALEADAAEVVVDAEIVQDAQVTFVGVEEVVVDPAGIKKAEYVAVVREVLSSADAPIALYCPEPGLLSVFEEANSSLGHALVVVVEELPVAASKTVHLKYLYVDEATGTIYVLSTYGVPRNLVFFKSCCLHGPDKYLASWSQTTAGYGIIEEVESIDPGEGNLFHVLDDGINERMIATPWGTIVSFRRYEPDSTYNYSARMRDFSTKGLLYIYHSNCKRRYRYTTYVGLTLSGFNAYYPSPRQCVYPVADHEIGRLRSTAGCLYSYDYGCGKWTKIGQAMDGGFVPDMEFYCTVISRDGSGQLMKVIEEVDPGARSTFYQKIRFLVAFGLDAVPPTLPGKALHPGTRNMLYVSNGELRLCDVKNSTVADYELAQKTLNIRYVGSPLEEEDHYPPYFSSAWRFEDTKIDPVDMLRRYIADYEYYKTRKPLTINLDIVMRGVYLSTRYVNRGPKMRGQLVYMGPNGIVWNVDKVDEEIQELYSALVDQALLGMASESTKGRVILESVRHRLDLKKQNDKRTSN